jgi:hypothetical protein
VPVPRTSLDEAAVSDVRVWLYEDECASDDFPLRLKIAASWEDD